MEELNIYQYTCPSCGYTLYSEKVDEELYCHNKECSFKEALHNKNYIETKIVNDNTTYTVKESFMVDHGCHEVRPIKKGTKIEVIKIKKDWFLCETLDGFNFFAPKNRFDREK